MYIKIKTSATLIAHNDVQQPKPHENEIQAVRLILILYPLKFLFKIKEPYRLFSPLAFKISLPRTPPSTTAFINH